MTTPIRRQSTPDQNVCVAPEAPTPSCGPAPSTVAGDLACNSVTTHRGAGGLPTPPEPKAGPDVPSLPAHALMLHGADACSNAEVFESNGVPADLRCMMSSENSHVQYYRSRADDFRKRNPGEEPPAYYLAYGEKYARAFSLETYGKLSPAGQKWLDGTRRSLQDAIETLREKDPKAFAELERNPEAFKSFCFDSHVDAYLDNGLMRLPLKDLAVISLTPEFKELADPATQKQIALALWKGKADLAQALAQTPDLLQDIMTAAYTAVATLPNKLSREVR